MSLPINYISLYSTHIINIMNYLCAKMSNALVVGSNRKGGCKPFRKYLPELSTHGQDFR